jgi:adenosylcobinamide-GDP ribazoletransferase
MRGLAGAIGLLTVLPVPRYGEWQGRAMLPWFPVVGMILGGLWAALDALAGLIFPHLLRGAIATLFLVLLTGGLHLDGLADTADGLLSHRSRDKALEIMKDSRIGTWGVLALFGVLGFKTLALAQDIHASRALVLVLVPVYGRIAMLLGIWILPYGRAEDGMARELFNGNSGMSCVPGSLLAGIGSTLLGWPGAILINGVCVVVIASMLSLFWLRARCITGDMLGALGEVTETVLLVAMAAS